MKFISGTYLFDVHDTNDIATAKSVLKYIAYCSSQEEVDRTVGYLLKGTEKVTEWGWVRIYLEVETQNRWPR